MLRVSAQWHEPSRTCSTSSARPMAALTAALPAPGRRSAHRMISLLHRGASSAALAALWNSRLRHPLLIPSASCLMRAFDRPPASQRGGGRPRPARPPAAARARATNLRCSQPRRTQMGTRSQQPPASPPRSSRARPLPRLVLTTRPPPACCPRPQQCRPQQARHQRSLRHRVRRTRKTCSGPVSASVSAILSTALQAPAARKLRHRTQRAMLPP
mmetsp:Transcript_48504/g.96641  ORF Transcript_48504/g.96641 Transcript_48504/m.96641 type:complete len:215 (-) Transcript_48504:2359-3003(-)